MLVTNNKAPCLRVSPTCYEHSHPVQSRRTRDSPCSVMVFMHYKKTLRNGMCATKKKREFQQTDKSGDNAWVTYMVSGNLTELEYVRLWVIVWHVWLALGLFSWKGQVWQGRIRPISWRRTHFVRWCRKHAKSQCFFLANTLTIGLTLANKGAEASLSSANPPRGGSPDICLVRDSLWALRLSTLTMFRHRLFQQAFPETCEFSESIQVRAFPTCRKTATGKAVAMAYWWGRCQIGCLLHNLRRTPECKNEWAC